jgi:phage-related protein
MLQHLRVEPPYKPVWFCSGAKAELRGMPKQVTRVVGVAIRAAQGVSGRKHPSVKAYTTHKHKGWSVVEILEPFDTDTYRVFYSVLADTVFILCGFKKKSHRGIETPKVKKDLIDSRVVEAKATSKNPPAALVLARQEYTMELTKEKKRNVSAKARSVSRKL